MIIVEQINEMVERRYSDLDVKINKIYVPSASVDAYKAASGWSTYASQIYGE